MKLITTTDDVTKTNQAGKTPGLGFAWVRKGEELKPTDEFWAGDKHGWKPWGHDCECVVEYTFRTPILCSFFRCTDTPDLCLVYRKSSSPGSRVEFFSLSNREWRASATYGTEQEFLAALSKGELVPVGSVEAQTILAGKVQGAYVEMMPTPPVVYNYGFCILKVGLLALYRWPEGAEGSQVAEVHDWTGSVWKKSTGVTVRSFSAGGDRVGGVPEELAKRYEAMERECRNDVEAIRKNTPPFLAEVRRLQESRCGKITGQCQCETANQQAMPGWAPFTCTQPNDFKASFDSLLDRIARDKRVAFKNGRAQGLREAVEKLRELADQLEEREQDLNREAAELSKEAK